MTEIAFWTFIAGIIVGAVTHWIAWYRLPRRLTGDGHGLQIVVAILVNRLGGKVILTRKEMVETEGDLVTWDEPLGGTVVQTR